MRVRDSPQRGGPGQGPGGGERHVSGPLAGGGLLLASCTSIQVGAALARGTFVTTGPLGAAGWRFALAAAIMLVLARPQIRGWSPARWRRVIAFGVAAAGNEVCLYEALVRLPLGLAVTIEFLGPVAVALGAGPGRRRLSCAILALAGVCTICVTTVRLNPLGLAFALLAGAGWAAYILASRSAGRDQRPLDSLAVSLSVGALLCLPLALAHAGALATHATTALTLAIVAILGTVTPYALELAALRRLAPGAAGVLFSIEPAIAAVVGLLVLNQGLRAAQLLGIAMVLLAGAGVLRDPA